MSNIHPILQKHLDELNSQMGDDFQFYVWVRFGGGTAATVFNERCRVTVLLELQSDESAHATVSAAVPGFFGAIQGSRMTLPNKMLVTSIQQIETILYFLPEKGTANINDFYGHVVANYMLEKRKERREKREQSKG